MLKFLTAVIFLLTIAITGRSQNFPATEKEVNDILCITKWKADTIMMGEKKMAANELFGDVFLEFKSDGSYTITVMGRDKKGTWKTDMAKKTVNVFEKEELETVIRDMVAARIVLSEAEPESADEAMTMIFKPVK
jgi:hypothetical protein